MSGHARACALVLMGLASAGFLASGRVWPQDASPRAQLAALIRSGDLLLRQAAVLRPRGRELDKRGAELTAGEKRLDADVAAEERLILAYNADAGALASEAAAQRERCVTEPLDAEQVRECNDAGAKLAARALLLDRRRAKLDERRHALNQSIDRHNARRSQWERAKREQDRHRSANEAQARQWLQRARALWSSDGFAALSKAARTPAACSAAQLSTSDAAHPFEALKRMQQCFKSVAR